jgi:hypothetical protein
MTVQTAAGPVASSVVNIAPEPEFVPDPLVQAAEAAFLQQGAGGLEQGRRGPPFSPGAAASDRQGGAVVPSAFCRCTHGAYGSERQCVRFAISTVRMVRTVPRL